MVPLASTDVPLTDVAPELIGLLIIGHVDLAKQFAVLGEHKPW